MYSGAVPSAVLVSRGLLIEISVIGSGADGCYWRDSMDKDPVPSCSFVEP